MLYFIVAQSKFLLRTGRCAGLPGGYEHVDIRFVQAVLTQRSSTHFGNLITAFEHRPPVHVRNSGTSSIMALMKSTADLNLYRMPTAIAVSSGWRACPVVRPVFRRSSIAGRCVLKMPLSFPFVGCSTTAPVHRQRSHLRSCPG